MNSLYALAALFVATVAARNTLSSYMESREEMSPVSKLANDDVSITGLVSNVHDGHGAHNAQVVSNLAHHRCVQAGHITTVFDGIDVTKTPTLLKTIDRQLEVAFFVPSTLLTDNTVLANCQAALRKNHVIGLRFDPIHDNALNALTEDVVNSKLATAEVHFKKTLGRNLQYVMFAYGTPEFAYKIAEKRFLRVVNYNIDFSQNNVNHVATLDVNFSNPKQQSFVILQSAYSPEAWETLRTAHNAGVVRGFQTVRLSTCLPPLRDAGIEVQAVANNNPASTPPANPQAINNNNNASNMASPSASVQSALIGCAIALAILVLA